ARRHHRPGGRRGDRARDLELRHHRRQGRGRQRPDGLDRRRRLEAVLSRRLTVAGVAGLSVLLAACGSGGGGDSGSADAGDATGSSESTTAERGGDYGREFTGDEQKVVDVAKAYMA